VDVGQQHRHRHGHRGPPRQGDRTTEGADITRNGSDDDPASVIEQEDGTTGLKLASE